MKMMTTFFIDEVTLIFVDETKIATIFKQFHQYDEYVDEYYHIFVYETMTATKIKLI